MTELEPVVVEESKTHSYEYIMKKKRELYALQRKVNDKLRELKAKQERFDYLCNEFAKTNVPKLHNSKDVMKFLSQYEGLYRFMAHTQIPDTWTFQEHYGMCKEIVEKWNLKDVKEMWKTCLRAFKLTPLQLLAKFIVDDARQYCRLFEAYNEVKR